jgi:hypothetical protein
MPESEHELVTIPVDLTLLGDNDLGLLEIEAVAAFDRIRADQTVTPQSIEYLMALSSGIDRIRSESAVREVRRADDARREQERLTGQREALGFSVHPDEAPATPAEIAVQHSATQIAEAAARGMGEALVAALDGGALNTNNLRRSRSLGAARGHAPQTVIPTSRQVVTAGVDIPGIARGGELTTLDSVVDAFHRRAKGMPVTRNMRNEQLVASLRNEFEHTVDDRTSPSQVEDLLSYMTGPEKQNALVAGGGWCAPSETRYEFFQSGAADGLIDLPTIGITRGGIKFPVSPSLADAFGANGLAPFAVPFSNTSVPWLWTETDDINTVTGSTNKPTLRVPCPTFSEARLECYGVTLTAGNLTDDAYPEATRNTLRLLLLAHAHAMNARIISTMVSLSTAAVTGGGFADANDVVTQTLGGIALSAVDYRARYGMSAGEVLEVVAPYWLLEVIRAGLSHRTGVGGGSEFLAVADSTIQSYFADRNVRVQFVNDWQVRGTGQFGNATAMTAWPTAVTVMVYSAGTFVLGNGLQLDLGVVRDSALNAENDFTAAWSEECHLVAKVGHESRQYTLGFSVSAVVPPAETSAANL